MCLTRTNLIKWTLVPKRFVAHAANLISVTSPFIYYNSNNFGSSVSKVTVSFTISLWSEYKHGQRLRSGKWKAWFTLRSHLTRSCEILKAASPVEYGF